MTLNPFTQYALLAFLVLLLLRVLVRRLPAVRKAGPEYAFYTRRMKGAALLSFVGAAVLGTVLALAHIEQWEPLALAYGVMAWSVLMAVRLAEHRQRKDGQAGL